MLHDGKATQPKRRARQNQCKTAIILIFYFLTFDLMGQPLDQSQCAFSSAIMSIQIWDYKDKGIPNETDLTDAFKSTTHLFSRKVQLSRSFGLHMIIA